MFLIARQNRYLRRFEEAHATGSGQPHRLGDLGLRNSRVFQRLNRRGVFMEIAAGQFQFVPAAADAFKRQRRTQALIGWALVVSVLAMIGLLRALG